MMTPRRRSLLDLACLLGFALSLAPACAQTTLRASVASDGTQGNDRWTFDAASGCAVSADGRYVVFSSVASSLVAGDTNGARDIFLRDMEMETTKRVSVSTDGHQANGNSQHPSVSADGRYVAFASNASNLVAGDTNDRVDVFVRDVTAGTTRRVSVNTKGTQGNDDSGPPSISADGRYIAFSSGASNLVAGDANDYEDEAGFRYGLDVFVHDTAEAVTRRVSIATDGTEGNGNSEYAAISADGRHVAFWSSSSNLVTGDTNGSADVFVHDTASGATKRVSIATNGAQGDSYSGYPAISADGRYVAFQSSASNLVATGTRTSPGVYLRDTLSGTTERVSIAWDGTPNIAAWGASISADGRYVAFVSYDAGFVPGDTNGRTDVFVRDTVARETVRVSVGADGAQGNGNSSDMAYPSISRDGRFVAFYSFASNLVPGDTNDAYDVFVRGPLPVSPVQYTLADAANALRIGAGLRTPAPNEAARLNADASAGIDARDAVCIARKASGLETSPGG